jgi:peptidyl-prolyl cis-trans isomerase D
MFDFVRKHTKVMQLILFLLIFPSFVLFGLDGYSRFRDQGAAAAVVDGQKILQTQWDDAHKADSARLREQYPDADPKLLDSPEIKYASLERLVRDRVLGSAAYKSNIVASNAALQRELLQNEAIAGLRKPDGSLDIERYRALLAQRGLSPEGYEAGVRTELSSRQVLLAVAQTGVPNAALADSTLGAYYEKRDVQVMRFAANEWAQKLTLSDADVERFYKDNAQLFQAPEQADVEYVQLDLDALRKTIEVSEADVKSYFDANKDRLLNSGEERRASHILITANKTMSAEDRNAARSKAQQLLTQVRSAPASFADVAKKNSQDPGSAANGGDLDFFARGAMVKPFEEAVFGMKPGDISDLVETDFGFHIIRLTEVKGGTQKTFEQVKGEIAETIRRDQAPKRFAEIAESFTNMVYEQPDALKPVADRFKLELRTIAGVGRKPAPNQQGVLSNTKLLDAIFSAESVQNKRNSQAIDLGGNRLVSARVVKHSPARTMAFEEVKDAARARALAQKGAELAKVEGEKALKTLQAAGTATATVAAGTFSETLTVSRIQSQRLTQPMIDAVLRADGSKLPATVGVDLGAAGYAVIRVLKVLPRDARPAEELKQDRNQFAKSWSSAEATAYYDLLKSRFKTEFSAPKPARSATSVTQ